MKAELFICPFKNNFDLWLYVGFWENWWSSNDNDFWYEKKTFIDINWLLVVLTSGYSFT